MPGTARPEESVPDPDPDPDPAASESCGKGVGVRGQWQETFFHTSSLVFPSNSTSSSILPLLLFLLLSACLSQSSDSCSSVCGAQISRLSITTTSVALAPPPEASLVCNLSIKPANYSHPECGGGAARPSEERRRQRRRGGR